MEYTRWNGEQAKVCTNATQLFEALEELRQHDSRFHGSMHWKRVRGRDYLYRGFTGGRARSLGPRSEETEATKARFDQGKAEHKEQTRALIEKLEVHAGYVKVNRLNRFPSSGARVIRAFQRAGVPHRIIGTNALYAYEVSAGVTFLPEHLATEDMDVLVDDRQGLKIAARLGKQSLLSIIQKTDRSFRRLTSSPVEFAAVNSEGYRVELITQGAKSPMQPTEFSRALDGDDLRPVAINSLKWLVSSPRYSEVVFDEQGRPLRVETVDPRAFVLFKHFVSERDDRHPAKRRRDAAQARVVASLLADELRHLPPSQAITTLFPASVVGGVRSADDDFSL